MRDKVLYFPHIRVPDSPWFIRMLLYWQEVGTIVPYELLQNPDRLGKHTQDLLTAQLVKDVIPGIFVYRIPNFASSFVTFLEKLGGELDDRRRDFKGKGGVQIHAEKMDDLAEELVRLGLASRKAQFSPWFIVEKRTADEFMCYLAAVLSRFEEMQSVPVTDDEGSLAALLRLQPAPNAVENKLRSVRMAVLKQALPVPETQLDVPSIRRFKDKHGEELKLFRRNIEQRLTFIADMQDPDLRDHQLGMFLEEINDEVDKIRGMMKANGWTNVLFGKICAVLAPLPVIGMVPGLVNAVYSAFGGGAADVTRLPLAYAAFVREEFGHSDLPITPMAA